MSLRGGEIWKEGVDTCVFKPAVRCEGEVNREPNSVSRIVNTAQATRDLEVETLIRETFPTLVDAGLVTVHTKSCVPTYDASDLIKGFTPYKGDGCDKLTPLVPGPTPSHTNMVTPLRGETFYNFMRKNPAFSTDWKEMISGILLAAITLVPDDGPWIIHTDCHVNNILTIPKGVGEKPDLSLADWGRALIIKNPKDINSVRQGIREWAMSIPYLKIPKNANDSLLKTLIMQNLGDFPQHPSELHNIFWMVYMDDVGKQQMALSKLRAWLPYVLITQTYAMVNYDRQKEFADEVFRAIAKQSTNQETLGRLVEQTLYLPQQESKSSGGMYWPLKYYRGLTRKQNLQRKRSATRRTKMSFKNPKAYVPFKSDKGIKTRRSSYTERFHKKYPDAKSLSEISKATGISKSILQTVYDRGMAAWRTGHRPGASQHAWGMARVHSFVMKGKTYRTADADLARKV